MITFLGIYCVYVFYYRDSPPLVLPLALSVLVGTVIYCSGNLYHLACECRPLTEKDLTSGNLEKLTSLTIKQAGDSYSFEGRVRDVTLKGVVPSEYFKFSLNMGHYKEKYLGVKLARDTFVGKEYEYYIIEK